MTYFDATDGDYFTWDQPGPTSACINYAHDPEHCSGHVITVVSASGLTTSNKCQECVERLAARLDEVNRRYPDQSTPPDWFDPTYAGESWDDE